MMHFFPPTNQLQTKTLELKNTTTVKLVTEHYQSSINVDLGIFVEHDIIFSSRMHSGLNAVFSRFVFEDSG